MENVIAKLHPRSKIIVGLFDEASFELREPLDPIEGFTIPGFAVAYAHLRLFSKPDHFLVPTQECLQEHTGDSPSK